MIEFIDSQLLLLANGCHSLWADHFMMMFTGRFIWIPMYVALAIIILRQFPVKKAIIVLVGVGLAVAMADQICATLIRPVVGRLRPSNLDNPLSALVTIVDGYRGGSYGFPSCHAANSFALVAYVALMVPRRRLATFLLIWATVNSYSRLYLGVHYPGDLLVGTLIGTTCGAGLALIMRKMLGIPLPRLGGNSLPEAPRRITLWPSRLALSSGEGLSIPISDLALAVGLTTVLIMAALAA